MSAWQPIETAPDRGEFLVSGGTVVGEVGGSDPCTVAHVEASGGSYYSVQNCYGYSAWVDDPQYWMPLPDPPT